MRSKYSTEGQLDLSKLRHDVVSLLLPLETVIDLSNSEDVHLRSQALVIQGEILKALKSLASELHLLPDGAQLARTTREEET